ncbi:hypothetical protein [Curvibacter delicatus]|uniref:hypothetical protein n=1 Tax=Curvibacter delicatus TaxID=80879 RepID=UPI000ACEFC42|nr:hypothetical protein [Curvibacter delicatus]
MFHPKQFANLLSVAVLSFGLAAAYSYAAEPAAHGHGHDGAARVMGALENCGTVFDDRGLKPVKH